MYLKIWVTENRHRRKFDFKRQFPSLVVIAHHHIDIQCIGPSASCLGPASVSSAPHWCYHQLPQRIDYLNIEPIKCWLPWPHISSAQHWLARSCISLGGPALVLPPVASENLLSEYSTQHESELTNNYIVNCHHPKHGWEYLATCLGVQDHHLCHWA
jgi:hypothetical protein